MGVSDLLGIEELFLAQMQVNLLDWGIVDETKLALIEYLSPLFSPEIFVQQVDKLHLDLLG